MHYKLSPRDEIYNRKHKINKNTVNNEGSQLCLLLIGHFVELRPYHCSFQNYYEKLMNF